MAAEIELGEKTLVFLVMISLCGAFPLTHSDQGDGADGRLGCKK
jgi:hypothetical protein